MLYFYNALKGQELTLGTYEKLDKCLLNRQKQK
jgi:hypothetical protein